MRSDQLGGLGLSWPAMQRARGRTYKPVGNGARLLLAQLTSVVSDPERWNGAPACLRPLPATIAESRYEL